MSRNKKLLSLTKKDFVVQTFRSGGKGGQHQNKTDSGVRIIHPESSAKGESREYRSQHKNKKVAFERLVNSVKFKMWLVLKHKEMVNKETIEERVKKMMKPENLLIEARIDGKWEPIKDEL